ncbi:MAG: glycosyltransferase N-terminal domain-containing protein [Bacteroidota bacterium]|nr:hypothetical protein [Candidatus Kapabacteria bacterium]MDW8271034.1 glycosyltransferase N-terminal domain-containing protein [Bacteroidota bacterium]
MTCHLWHRFYNLVFIPFLLVATKIIWLFSPKLRSRHRILSKQKRSWQKQSIIKQRSMWFHAASMGELEQVKPLIRIMRQRYPTARIVVSVFSPSAYRQHSDIEINELLLLPYDTPSATRHLIEHIQPSLCIVSRYDLWWNLSYQLYEHGVPIVIVNATTPLQGSGLTFWRIMKRYYQCVYNRASLIIARDTVHASDLKKILHIPLAKVRPLCDIRVDQVLYRLSSSKELFSFIDATKFRVVLGSTWKGDEVLWSNAWQMLPPTLRQHFQLIIVPHEPTPKNCARILTLFPDATLLSRLDQAPDRKPQVVVVDKVGMLIPLYAQATAAYVGGGFDKGVHSVVEPALSGIPVAFGPRYIRNDDAFELLTYFVQLYLTQIMATRVTPLISNPEDAALWLRNLVISSAPYHYAQYYQAQLLTRQWASYKAYQAIETIVSSGTVHKLTE